MWRLDYQEPCRSAAVAGAVPLTLIERDEETSWRDEQLALFATYLHDLCAIVHAYKTKARDDAEKNFALNGDAGICAVQPNGAGIC